MTERAQVAKNGAVLLGDSVACDAFDEHQTPEDCDACSRRPSWRITKKPQMLPKSFDDSSHKRPRGET